MAAQLLAIPEGDMFKPSRYLIVFITNFMRHRHNKFQQYYSLAYQAPFHVKPSIAWGKMNSRLLGLLMKQLIDLV